MNLRAGKFTLELDRPKVMGIVNVTPDSFSDGGKFFARSAAIAHGRCLIEDGADILDIGGESTRPGATEATLQEELDRVMPVLDALVTDGIPISIDTQKPEVMAAAIAAGASMINDVNALLNDDAVSVCAASSVAVCLMHRQGTPTTMQQAPAYADVVNEVSTFLATRASACIDAGIARDRIAIDPGFGFGKSVEHNFRLLRELNSIAKLGFPVLAGFSRKASLGAVTGRAATERLAASIAAAILCAQNGATILRVHDVRETLDAIKVLMAATGR
ncbi:MAG: dihydropteroate synthase [Burkholderiales bacterium]|nr:dihydropteroate synthase [Burkholderiales bacterium]